jgi:hypothetical protein
MGREGSGGGDGGRELNLALGPEGSLGAKTGVSWCELQTTIGTQYDQKLRGEACMGMDGIKDGHV